MMTERLTLSSGNTTIEVWTIGARLNAASWCGIGNLLDGASTEEEARGAKLNHGCVVGPVANRLANGHAEIAGVVYTFEANENGTTTLHSGSKSTRDADWSVESNAGASAVLTLARAHLEDDFPGDRIFRTQYNVLDDGFDVVLSAETDAVTLVNLALHPYWTLAALGRDDLNLSLNSDEYLPVNQSKIPLGDVAFVEGTGFDLRNPTRPVPDHIDHNYCLNGELPAARLASDRVALTIDTDAPGLQVYTGKPFGIALEPQHWPDAPHHPSFPSIVLEPGQRYSQTTRYRFSKP